MSGLGSAVVGLVGCLSVAIVLVGGTVIAAVGVIVAVRGVDPLLVGALVLFLVGGALIRYGREEA